MKTKFTTLLLTLSIIMCGYSQNNNLVIFSQDGLKFTVILNGIRQNGTPETNVKVTGLNAPNYKVKVIFANKLPDLDQNAFLMDGGNPTQNTEYTYSVKNVKGKYKLRFQSAAPISASSALAPQQIIVGYSPVDVTSINTNTSTSGNTVNTNINSTNVNTTTTTTTSTVATNATIGGSSVGINMNGVGLGVGININVTDPTMGNTTGTTNSTSTTTYSTTTGSNTSSLNNNNTYVLPGYSGVYGCPYPMSQSDFESAKKSIASKGFDDSKLTIAKQIVGSNCLLCSQIKELMLLMSFEESRLDLAKFAWTHNLDRGNYYKLNDAFTFESSIDELNQYTQSH